MYTPERVPTASASSTEDLVDQSGRRARNGGDGGKTRGSDEWLQIAEEHASRLGFAIAKECLEYMHPIFLKGEREVLQNPGRREEAIGDLKTFVERMVKDAETENRLTLDVASYEAAKAACGLFPWCYLKRGDEEEEDE